MVTPSKNQNTSNIKLSIQVSLDGLSFCALSTVDKKIVYFKNVAFKKKLNPFDVLREVETVYQSESFLKEEKFDVTVLFSNDLYSLVPEKFFQEDNASDYLKFNTRILENDYVAHDVIPRHDIVNVYVPYTNINNFFFEQYGEFEYRHCLSILVNAFMEKNETNDKKPQVYINFNTGSFDLIAIKKHTLLLANTFSIQSPEDFIYYILFTAEQLELDPESLDLILLGKITSESEFYDIAYRYIRHVRFLNHSFGFSFTGQNEPPKASENYTLLKALL